VIPQSTALAVSPCSSEQLLSCDATAILMMRTCSSHICSFCCYRLSALVLDSYTLVNSVSACFLDKIFTLTSGLSCCLWLEVKPMKATPACVAALFLAVMIRLMHSHHPATQQTVTVLSLHVLSHKLDMILSNAWLCTDFVVECCD